MEEHGEVCIQEEVARLWDRGLSEDEIAQRIGLDPGYVSSVVAMLVPDIVGEDRADSACCSDPNQPPERAF